MDKKYLLAKVLNVLVPLGILIRIRAFFLHEIIVLAYHRVCDVNKHDYIFDMELVSASVDEFEKQVAYVKKYYNPVSMEQFIDYIEKGIPLPKRALLITFDDGFDDNYYNAFPVLKKYNVPATIFVSTGYVSTDKTIWFDYLAALIYSIDDTELAIPETGKNYSLNINKKSRTRVMEEICEDLKLLPNNTRESVLKRLNSKYADVVNAIDTRPSRMLSWQQIKEMSNSIISIGSHTVSHPVLTKLNSKELEYELSESKRILEEKLGCPVNSISYPNGNSDSFNDDVISKLKEIGYKVAFTYLSGCNYLPSENRFTLNRLHVEEYTKIQKFKFMCLLPTVFS